MFTGRAVSLYAPQFPIHCFITYILLFQLVDLFCSLSILRVLKGTLPGQGEMERRERGEREKKGMNAIKKRAFIMGRLGQPGGDIDYQPSDSGHLSAVRLHHS